MYEITVSTEKGSAIIIGDIETIREIKLELSGCKSSISEYKTKKGKIITDLEILGLISIKQVGGNTWTTEELQA